MREELSLAASVGIASGKSLAKIASDAAKPDGLLLVAASLFLPGQSPKQAWRIMWRDHARTESPNAGWPMSAMAGSLGVQLEKVTASGESVYRLGDQDHALGPQDITHSVRSMYLVAGLGLVLALGLTYVRAYFLW